MAPIHLSRTTRPSTDRGFSSFYCDKCRNGHMPGFQVSIGARRQPFRRGDIFGGVLSQAGNSAYDPARSGPGPRPALGSRQRRSSRTTQCGARGPATRFAERRPRAVLDVRPQTEEEIAPPSPGPGEQIHAKVSAARPDERPRLDSPMVARLPGARRPPAFCPERRDAPSARRLRPVRREDGGGREVLPGVWG